MHQISWTFKCRVRLTPSLFLRHRGGCTVAWNTQGEKREYDEKNKKKKMLSMWVRMVRIADHFLSNSRFKTRLVENNTRWLPAIRHLDKSTMFVALLCGFVAGAVLVLVLDVFAIWYWLRLKPKEEPKLVPDFVKVKNPKVSILWRKEGPQFITPERARALAPCTPHQNDPGGHYKHSREIMKLYFFSGD